MPLFFFHLRTPAALDVDDEGIALPDLETAYLEACEAIPDIASDFMAERKNPLAYSFVIADSAGQTLMEVSFDEGLRDELRPIRPGQHNRARRLAQEIADAIGVARAARMVPRATFYNRWRRGEDQERHDHRVCLRSQSRIIGAPFGGGVDGEAHCRTFCWGLFWGPFRST